MRGAHMEDSVTALRPVRHPPTVRGALSVANRKFLPSKQQAVVRTFEARTFGATR